MIAMNAMNQALGRMRSWFGGAQEKAIDVLPVRLGGPQYHRPTQTPASVLGLDQVAARRRVGSRVGTRAPDHRHPERPRHCGPHLADHASPPTNWSAAASSGPRNRRPIVSNSAGEPVVTKEYDGSPLSRIRPVSASTR